MPFIYEALARDIIANRPSAGKKGHRFLATDTSVEYYDDGAAWQAVTLDAGQLAGTVNIARLPAIPESQITGLAADLAATEQTANKGAANGYAPLDSGGKVPSANLPPASGLAKYTTSWTSQTSVTVTHSLGTTAVIVQVYDASGVLVAPESITATSSTVVTLTFGAAFTGSVVVIG